MSIPRRVRRPTKFEAWALAPAIVLRVSLVTEYLLYCYGSAIAFIAGVPLFSLVTWEGYTPVWAVLMGTSAVIAAIGSVSDRWDRIEKWAALSLTAMMLGYAGGMNLVGFAEADLKRQFVGVVAVIAMVLPATRFAWLAAQSGKRHRDDG